jgi:predicted permease
MVIDWMVSCWISTVVLGMPLITAVLGVQYAVLAVAAAISSFIFQLPVMLFALDYSMRTLAKENETPRVPSSVQPNTRRRDRHEGNCFDDEEMDGEALEVVVEEEGTGERTGSRIGHVVTSTLRNPVLLAIVVGVALSESRIGPKYLNPGRPSHPPNCCYIEEVGFIALTLQRFSQCLQPMALLSVGIFLLNKSPIACGLFNSLAYMAIKVVAVPGLMVLCALAVGLAGAEARAAVLLASLPVSAAAYTLSERYGIGQKITESNIFLGNLLVLPTTIGWVSFMDAIELFPVEAHQVNHSITPSP